MESSTGRNQPCPCGSGKKYKRCCGTPDPLAAVQYTSEDRASVQRALESFARVELDIGASLTAFLPSVREEEIAETLELSLVSDMWLMWAILDDYEARISVRFKRRYHNRLTLGQRRYFDALVASEMRVYDVRKVEPGVDCELRDRLDRTSVTVTERLATQTLVRGDVIAVRLIAGKVPETIEIEHPLIVFTQTEARLLVDDLRAVRRQLRRKYDAAGAADEMRMETPIIVNEYWLDRLEDLAALRRRGRSNVRTPEGDPFAFHAVTFTIKDRELLLARLRTHAGFRPENEAQRRFVWTEVGTPDRRLLGSVEIDGNVVRAETMSAERASRFLTEFGTLAGDSVAFTSIDAVDAAELDGDDADELDGSDSLDIPPELEAQIIGEYYGKHYATWPDTPLPALDGRTPREATAVPALRKRLIAMLRDFDTESERARIDGKPYFNFTPIWRDLGISRSRVR